MVMRSFDYTSPGSLEEALSLLSSADEGWHVLSGGTNLVVELRDRAKSPSVVLDISFLEELRYIREDGERIRIGARASVEDLLRSELIRERAGVLRECALNFAGPPIRNRATVAGNVVDASPAADCTPPLQALDAEVVLRSAGGERRVALVDFVTGVRETVRRPDELLVELSFEGLDGESGYGYYKLGRRKAMAISVVSAAVVLRMSGGRCRSAGISLGAASPVPFRVGAAETLLTGEGRLSDDEIEECGRLAGASSRPIDDIRASGEYRRLMCEVLTKRLVRRALGREE